VLCAGVLFLAAPFAVVQGLYASLLGDDVKRVACNVEEHSGAYFTTPALVTLGAVVLAMALALPRPRWAAAALGAGAIAAGVFAARGGWAAGGCALGV
jgi:hypothetical protein